MCKMQVQLQIIAGSQKESGMSVISTLGTEHERWV